MQIKQSQQQIRAEFQKLQERLATTDVELDLTLNPDGSLSPSGQLNGNLILGWCFKNCIDAAGITDVNADNMYRAVCATKNLLTFVAGKAPKTSNPNKSQMATPDRDPLGIQSGLEAARKEAQAKNCSEAGKLMAQAQTLAGSYQNNTHSRRARGQEAMKLKWDAIVAPFLKAGAPSPTYAQAEGVMAAVKAALSDTYREIGQ